jgi:hypothetical protein
MQRFCRLSAVRVEPDRHRTEEQKSKNIIFTDNTQQCLFGRTR